VAAATIAAAAEAAEVATIAEVSIHKISFDISLYGILYPKSLIDYRRSTIDKIHTVYLAVTLIK
jgi:hypothetical protein